MYVDGQRVNITCVYGAPSTSMKTFNDIMYDKIVNQFSNKKSLLCGDFNIDLLKADVHVDTELFLDLLLVLGFSH